MNVVMPAKSYYLPDELLEHVGRVRERHEYENESQALQHIVASHREATDE